MTKNISITIDQDLLEYLDKLADINGRTRSGMIAWIIAKEKAADAALDEESKSYGVI